MSAVKSELRVARSNALDAFARLEARLKATMSEAGVPSADGQSLGQRIDALKTHRRREPKDHAVADLDRIAALLPLRNAVVHAEIKFGSHAAMYTNISCTKEFPASHIMTLDDHKRLIATVDALLRRP